MPERGDLSVTALYTSATWSWAGFAGAELFETDHARWTFRLTNGALQLARLAHPLSVRPSLPHSLVQRHQMFDALLQQSDGVQVVELAAGLSRRGVWATEDPTVDYVEIDLPQMIATKESLLQRSPEGCAVLARPNLRRQAADLAQELPALDLDPRRPLLVLAEGLLMYLDAEQQRTLWRRVHQLLASCAGGRFVFDLVPANEKPPTGFAGRVLGRAMKCFTRGQGFVSDARGRHDLSAELQDVGFDAVTLHEPHTAPRHWNLRHRHRATQVLLFDCAF